LALKKSEIFQVIEMKEFFLKSLALEVNFKTKLPKPNFLKANF
jgi:hypothetical protein